MSKRFWSAWRISWQVDITTKVFAEKKKKKKKKTSLHIVSIIVRWQDLGFNKRPVLGNNFSSSICAEQLCCNAKKVSDEWTAESSCC